MLWIYTNKKKKHSVLYKFLKKSHSCFPCCSGSRGGFCEPSPCEGVNFYTSWVLWDLVLLLPVSGNMETQIQQDVNITELGFPQPCCTASCSRTGLSRARKSSPTPALISLLNLFFSLPPLSVNQCRSGEDLGWGRVTPRP